MANISGTPPGQQAPVNTSPPTISGTAQAGQTLTANNGIWSGSSLIYTYQWKRCDSGGNACVAIAGATGQTYGLTAVDVGATMRVQVTAKNKNGTSSATSAATAVVIAAVAPPPPPTITSFTPSSGLVGDSVVITGTNFTGATAVKFGGTSATFTFNSATQITTSVPSGAMSGTLSVTTAGGTATSSGSFTVTPPAPVGFPVSGILDAFDRANTTPPAPPSASWTTTDGLGFKVVSNQLVQNTAGDFSEQKWNPATYLNPEIYATVGGVPAGEFDYLALKFVKDKFNVYQLAVTPWTGVQANPQIEIQKFIAGAKYPLVTTSVPLANGDGLGLSFVSGVLTAYKRSSGTWAPILTVADSTFTGAFDLRIWVFSTAWTLDDFGGGSASAQVLNPPTISSFSPTSALVGAGITIAGTYFTGATAVKFNGVAASFTVVSATQITATVPAATTGPISVTTPSGTGTSTGSFTVTPPPVGPVYPASYTTGPLGANNILPTKAGAFLISQHGGTDGTWNHTKQRQSILQRQADMGRIYDGLQFHYTGSNTWGGVYGCEDPTDINGANAPDAQHPNGITAEQWTHNNGSFCCIAWTPDYTITQMNAGAADAAWAKMANYWKQYPFPIMLRTFVEFDNPGPVTSAIACANNGFVDTCGATFIAVWRRMVGIFKANGANNVGFWWNPEEGVTRTCISSSYPGDAYVDWIGSDWYNTCLVGSGWCTPMHQGWASFAECFNYTALGNVNQSQHDRWGPQKPFVIGETGTWYDSNYPTYKGIWYRNIPAAAKNMQYLRGISFYDEDVRYTATGTAEGPLNNFRVDAATDVISADVYAGFKACAADPWFNTK